MRTPSRRASAAPQLGADEADRDGEVDVLATARHEDADDVPLLVERRAAGIAWVRSRVRLDRAARHAADDSRGDGAIEPVRAPEEEQLVAGARRPCARGLPKRARPGRGGA